MILAVSAGILIVALALFAVTFIERRDLARREAVLFASARQNQDSVVPLVVSTFEKSSASMTAGFERAMEKQAGNTALLIESFSAHQSKSTAEDISRPVIGAVRQEVDSILREHEARQAVQFGAFNPMAPRQSAPTPAEASAAARIARASAHYPGERDPIEDSLEKNFGGEDPLLASFLKGTNNGGSGNGL